MLVEASRQIVFNLIVSFHFRHDPGDRSTWSTVKLLKAEMAHAGLLSARRIDRLVSQFSRPGFLSLQPLPADRRVKILTPTAKMIAMDQDWLIINYKPLHVMFPEGGYSRFIERDPAIQRAHRLIALGFFAQAATIMDGNPAIMRFLNRDAGSMILFKLVQLATLSDASSALSYTEIGTRFGVSRTHVRMVLKEAEENGDVILHGRGGRHVELRPSLIQAFDRFLADIMSGNDLLFQLALKSLDGR